MTAPVDSMIPEEEVRSALAPHYILEKERHVNRVITSLITVQTDLLNRESKLSSSKEEASRGTSGVATDTLERVVWRGDCSRGEGGV